MVKSSEELRRNLRQLTGKVIRPINRWQVAMILADTSYGSTMCRGIHLRPHPMCILRSVRKWRDSRKITIRQVRQDGHFLIS